MITMMIYYMMMRHQHRLDLSFPSFVSLVLASSFVWMILPIHLMTMMGVIVMMKTDVAVVDILVVVVVVEEEVTWMIRRDSGDGTHVLGEKKIYCHHQNPHDVHLVLYHYQCCRRLINSSI